MRRTVTLRALVLLALLCASPLAQAQGPRVPGYGFPQLAATAWQRFGEAVAKVGTADEKAALARMRLSFFSEDHGAPSIETRCENGRCALRMNASFVGLSLVLARTGSAAMQLKADSGRATQCFAANIGKLAETAPPFGNDAYAPLLACLGKGDTSLAALTGDVRYNELAEIAATETLLFAFAHQLAHVRSGDLEFASDGRTLRDIEARADIDAIELLARAGADSFFGAGPLGVFRAAERLSVERVTGEYPPAECRMLYAIFAGGYFLLNLDRSKLVFRNEAEREPRLAFFDWKINEATAFVEQNLAKTKDGSCGGYFR